MQMQHVNLFVFVLLRDFGFATSAMNIRECLKKEDNSQSAKCSYIICKERIQENARYKEELST